MAEDTGITKLIEQMKLQNSHLGAMREGVNATTESQQETEKHTRNTRRHLLEMKKMQMVMNDFQARTVFGFENFAEMIDANKLQDQENEMERKTIFEDIRDALRNTDESTNKLKDDTAEGKSGIMENLGKIGGGGLLAVGMMILGVGLAGVGAGMILKNVGPALDAIEKADAEKIKENVVSLLGLKDVLTADKSGWEVFKDTGAFYSVMLGVGTGLAAFGIGGRLAGAEAVRDLDAEGIKRNVMTLLSIREGLIADDRSFIGESAVFFMSMSGIAAGLAVFGMGAAVGQLGQAGAEGISRFSQDMDFADNVKYNVMTLLSIGDDMGNAERSFIGESATFLLSMTGLATGLAVFGIGAGIAGLGQALANWGHDEWAQNIKDNVMILLSIAEEKGGDLEFLKKGGAFGGAMAGLAAGLSAFGTSQIIAALGNWAGGPTFGDNIKKNVQTLLTIADDKADVDKMHSVSDGLRDLGDALASFGGGSFVKALSDAGAAVLNFFSGGSDPVAQAVKIAEVSDDLESGVQSFATFADVLKDFESIKFDFNAEEFAGQLAIASETMEAVLHGGEIGEGWWDGEHFKFKGLKQYTNDIDELADALERLQQGFGGALNAMSGENSMLAIEAGAGGASVSNVIAPTSTTNSGGNITNIVHHDSTSKGKNAVQQSRET